MKKNIVQDVIPPRKTIRSVELLYKSKRPKIEENTEVVAPIKDRVKSDVIFEHDKPQPETGSSYRYEYDEPKRKSRKILYVSILVLVLAVFFGVSSLFKGAKIYITPKSEVAILDEGFTATKDNSSSGLSFQTVSTTKDMEKKVEATDEQMVEKKATGRIVVYNNFSSQAQNLVKTTRFETPEGLIFRAVTDVVVPGMQTKAGKTVAGSVEISVEADKAGPNSNIGLKDFTIPGLKGTPKYSKIYARSKTEMAGGFLGKQKTVSKETIDAIDKELEESLRISLAKDITSQIPENFVLYQNTISYVFEPTTQVIINNEPADGSVVLKKKGTIDAIIFDKGSLSREIIAKKLPDIIDNLIKIVNLNDLNLELSPEITFDPRTSTTLRFIIKGDANFVWIFDENKLKSELLGMSKNNVLTIIATYTAIKEAKIEQWPFWTRSIPNDPDDVKIINTVTP